MSESVHVQVSDTSKYSILGFVVQVLNTFGSYDAGSTLFFGSSSLQFG